MMRNLKLPIVIDSFDARIAFCAGASIREKGDSVENAVEFVVNGWSISGALRSV